MEPEPVLPSIDSLPAEVQTEVLLRVPTPAALVHAAAASKIWRGFVADGNFLARYRERHRCSPFLGLYVPRQFGGAPAFHVTDSIRSAKDRDLKDAAKRAYFGEIGRYQDHRLHDAGEAFVLGDPGVHKPCRILDCHNSRLLLTRGHEALEVRSPLTGETILLPFPPHVVHPDSLKACLLQGHGHDEVAAAKAFRVVFLQHRRQGRNQEARAVEYDSRRKSWQEHPWERETLQGNIIEGTPGELMRARHRVFCKYTGTSPVALLLDASDMRFSILPLPNHQNFAIGELDDNRCCFVESGGVADHRLRVWQLDENRLDWVLKKDIRMDQVLGENVGYYNPCVVSNGMALMCSRVNHQFVVDLNTYSVKEEFEFVGQSAYFMQMPWPPTFSRPMTNVTNPGSSEDGNNEIQHEVRDGAAPLNCMLSHESQYLDTPAAAEQYLDRVAFEEENADKSSVQVSGANKAYQALDADDSIMKNDKVHGGLTAQTAPEQENENNGTDGQKDNCRTSIPSSSMDQGINDSLEGLPQQDFVSSTSQDSEDASKLDRAADDGVTEGPRRSIRLRKPNLRVQGPEWENENNGTDGQKDNCRTSIPSSSMDQGINGSLEGLPQQDFVSSTSQDSEDASKLDLTADGGVIEGPRRSIRPRKPNLRVQGAEWA